VTVTVDLHAHTRFFHGFGTVAPVYDPLGARLLGRMAEYRGLDAVATTNHDYYRDLSAGDADVTFVPGIEVTTDSGHVLVVGPSPPKLTDPGVLTPEQVVEIAHERNCAAIIAHPFRNSTVRESDADFDAVERNGKGTESVEQVREFAAERDLPLVGGSDAHFPIEVGRAYTTVDAADATPEAVVDAIRSGDVEAHVDDTGGQRLFRAAYRFLHRQKGWLADPPAPTPGVGVPPGEADHDGGSLPGGVTGDGTAESEPRGDSP
jgi:predicted metal-dependent phosphoesterase TrpH